MPGFTAGGGKKAPINGKEDKVFPSKKAGMVARKTGSKGFPIADAGGKPPRATAGSDGTGFQDDHMEEAMSDGPGGGVAKGPSFAGKKKFGASAMSQALRKKASSGYP